MPEFPKPKFEFDYDIDAEIARLRQWRRKEDRFIPAKSNDTLLLATWNIANFGAQDRREQDHRLIAEILGWFESPPSRRQGAIWRTSTRLRRSSRVIAASLPTPRATTNAWCTLYDAKKGIAVREQVGEVAIEPSELKHIKLSGSRRNRSMDSTGILSLPRSIFKDAKFHAGHVHLLLWCRIGLRASSAAQATGDVCRGPLGARPESVEDRLRPDNHFAG